MKILIIEDIKAAHLLYEQALTNYNDNYSVKCIDRGKEALKELKYKKYNLIILDIDLPDIRGEEVLEKIREMGINTPVLILTAFGQKSLVINVTEFGIHDYLLKPLDLDVLRDRVNEILLGNKKIVKCPQCGSLNTKLVSQFGSTACKALFQCDDCLEPFDYFKCLK